MRALPSWLAVVTVVVGGLVLPSTASAATAPVAATSADTKAVTVVLKPQRPRVLARLAAEPVGNRGARLAALAEALPSSAERSRVADVLARHGLTVTDQSTWTVQATADQATVADAFGKRPRLPKEHTAAEFRAATGSLPDLPTALHGLVSGVYPTTGGPNVFHHNATSVLDGADVRNADTPAGVASSTGSHDGGLTIATLQLADFHSSDLTAYARRTGLADPVAAHRYRPVVVDGGPLPDDDAGGGAVEVALDQESLLSTAPSASQAAYFAPNTNGGYIDALAAVADDAMAGGRITALSISWGGCEALTGLNFINKAEPVLQSVVAAGVTIFAASGDNGIYDCGSLTGTGADDHQADVDFPASSPEVVAVGGTNLHARSPARNTGANWIEEAWSCSDASSCQNATTGTGGSGGGVSGSAYGQRTLVGTHSNFAGFAKPAWQRTNVTSAPYAATTTRMVPDIAADGDPQTGFAIYSTDTTWLAENRGSPIGVVGGTSLAAPLSAAQLTNVLGDAGRATGVGDIHTALYKAYAATQGLPDSSPKKVFRDVTAGTNGASGDRGTDPSVDAGPGYDTVSGLGGVLWPALTPYLLGNPAPRVTAALAKVRKGSTRCRTSVRFRWSSARGQDPMALAGSTAVVRSNGRVVFRSGAAHGPKLLRIRPGRRLTAVVTATDVLGTKATRTVHLRVTRVRRVRKHRRR